MDDRSYAAYLSLLKNEMITALGCTEPIAVAYAAAKARKVLACFPQEVTVFCSGNIVKNVKSVVVPNSGGMKGIEVAALLGIIGGNPENILEVLDGITDAQRAEMRKLLSKGLCKCRIKTGVDNLFIQVMLKSDDRSADVTIAHKHTNIVKIVRDGIVEYEAIPIGKNQTDDFQMSVNGILDFAQNVAMTDLEDCIGNEIAVNSAISREGLSSDYGAKVGKTIIDVYGDDVKFRAVASASAGSDARMGGCPMPVVINSGSGNQGLTVSLPVLEYAKALNASREMTFRALAVSNLISIHIKKNIGDLSAFCGAVSAACGAGAAITYLHGGSYEMIANTIINTIASVGGIICDGAKASCAAKIASSVNAAILSHEMSMRGIVFHDGDGIVQPDVEQTIKSIGYVGKVGMAKTDEEILRIMLGEVKFSTSSEFEK